MNHGERGQQTRARKSLPWIASVLGHVLLLGFVVLVSWNLAQTQDEKTTPLITAEVSEEYVAPMTAIEPESNISAPTELSALPTESPTDTIQSQFSLPTVASGLPSSLGAAGPMSLGRVSFAGLGGGAARRIVFVVDASGSMVGAFPVVIAELAQSLSNLSPAQNYAVIFFQRDEALVVPPKGKLTPATDDAVTRTLTWIRESVVPRGRSNPVEAIEQALQLDPEVVFLLSSNITGSGRYEVDLNALLTRLDALNPVDPRSGTRPTVINCIQFLDPDPLDALRAIATIHGAQGESPTSAYRFLGRVELGLAPGQR